MVVLAQLAEHRIVVPSVVGSSPTFHPKTEISSLTVADLFFYSRRCAKLFVYGHKGSP